MTGDGHGNIIKTDIKRKNNYFTFMIVIVVFLIINMIY